MGRYSTYIHVKHLTQPWQNPSLNVVILYDIYCVKRGLTKRFVLALRMTRLCDGIHSYINLIARFMGTYMGPTWGRQDPGGTNVGSTFTKGIAYHSVALFHIEPLLSLVTWSVPRCLSLLYTTKLHNKFHKYPTIDMTIHYMFCLKEKGWVLSFALICTDSLWTSSHGYLQI